MNIGFYVPGKPMASTYVLSSTNYGLLVADYFGYLAFGHLQAPEIVLAARTTSKSRGPS